MLLNFILFFVIPWIFGIFIYYKDIPIFLTTFTFSCMLSYTVNTLGSYMGFWNIYPYNQSYFSYIPLNLGLYPILGTFFAYLLHNKKLNPFIVLVAFAIISTLFKYIMLVNGRVIFGNGWNILYTFILFVILYYIGYLFYLTLKKKKIII